jgi:hypothetical protein
MAASELSPALFPALPKPPLLVLAFEPLPPLDAVVPLLGARLPLVAKRLPLLEEELPLLGETLPLLGEALPLAATTLPLESSPIVPAESPFAQAGAATARMSAARHFVALSRSITILPPTWSTGTVSKMETNDARSFACPSAIRANVLWARGAALSNKYARYRAHSMEEICDRAFCQYQVTFGSLLIRDPRACGRPSPRATLRQGSPRP